MTTETYKVLVPHDFSEIADCAINHAAKVASSFKGEVYLLHVVNKAKEVDAAKSKLKAIATKFSSELNINIEVLIRIGNIFEDIGDVAAEIGAGIIVMGTHGAKGFQKIIGSHAMRVITHSKVPFIVVQNVGPKEVGMYDDILVPIDFSKITKQKLTIAAEIGQHFKSKIHMFTPIETDEFLKKKLDNEISFAKNYFEEKGLAYDIVSAKKKGDFKHQMVRYAAEIDADLIAVVNTQSGALLPDFLGSEEQEVIANDAQIPVIVTNPTQAVVSGGVLGT